MKPILFKYSIFFFRQIWLDIVVHKSRNLSANVWPLELWRCECLQNISAYLNSIWKLSFAHNFTIYNPSPEYEANCTLVDSLIVWMISGSNHLSFVWPNKSSPMAKRFFAYWWIMRWLFTAVLFFSFFARNLFFHSLITQTKLIHNFVKTDHLVFFIRKKWITEYMKTVSFRRQELGSSCLAKQFFSMFASKSSSVNVGGLMTVICHLYKTTC